MTRRRDWRERFWSSVEKTDSCWIWRGRLVEGYGRFAGYLLGSPVYRTFTAHRVSYWMHKGDIPSGYHIDHLCRNRACVNPDHLEAVTPHENSRRVHDLMTAERVLDVRRRLRAGESTTELAESFGTSRALMKKIRQGELWREVCAQEAAECGGDLVIRRTKEQRRAITKRSMPAREEARLITLIRKAAVSLRYIQSVRKQLSA